MSRWFRVHDDLVDDPKVQLLSGDLVKVLLNLWCLASQNDGILPNMAALAFKLRMKPQQVAAILAELSAAGLIDRDGETFHPHNWNARQYKSDVSTDRVKRFRKRSGNVSSTVSETPPETETETETEQKDSAANAAGADAPIDHRKRLFDEGLAKLAKMTGKGPDACRSFVGKCLKAASDDAVTVLGLIEEAERNQVVDPSAWIAARLKTGDPHAKPRNAIIQAADDLRRTIASFDGPPRPADGLRSIQGTAPPRLLSNG